MALLVKIGGRFLNLDHVAAAARESAIDPENPGALKPCDFVVLLACGDKRGCKLGTFHAEQRFSGSEADALEGFFNAAVTYDLDGGAAKAAAASALDATGGLPVSRRSKRTSGPDAATFEKVKEKTNNFQSGGM